VTPIFDGQKEAKLIALACSEPPNGRARWSLRLLDTAGRLAACEAERLRHLGPGAVSQLLVS
jgi:hypothetical protein